MGDISDVITRLNNLGNAIEDTLQKEVSDVVRDAILESARRNVYDAYYPKFYSRRRENGGLLDQNSIDIKVAGNELEAKDNPDWQQLWGGGGTGIGSWRPSTRLAEAIASGQRRFNMHNAGPRPFHEDAEHRVIADGSVEDALKRGLERQGY